MGEKKKFHASENPKKAGIVIRISEKLSFKPKTVKRDKERHHII